VQAKWLGKCPDCGTWDGLEKFTELPTSAGRESASDAWLPPTEGDEIGDLPHADALPLEQIDTTDIPRLPTGVGEFDRVLGGGLVHGSVVLLGGDPGIGKSTLLLQTLAGFANAGVANGDAGVAGRSDAAPAGVKRDPRRRRRPDGSDVGDESSVQLGDQLGDHPERQTGVPGHRPILYVSSEESAQQIRLRADRLLAELRVGVGSASAADSEEFAGSARSRLYVLAETNLAKIGEQIRRLRPAVCAIDSIQMLHRADLDAAPGSVAQVRRCCTDLVYLAKRSGMPVIVVGHVTKDGQLAGPKLLEHLVDVVLSFEGDRHSSNRVVRAVKNRFGSTQEIGIFEMTGSGLREVEDAAGSSHLSGAPTIGTAISPTMLGTRCLLAEVEALTATGVLGNARRKASGVDPNRLAMLIAVLEKHGGLRLADQDVFVSSAGGIRAAEPANDLAIALAIAGVHLRRTLPRASAAIGEVGLTGRLRSVAQLEFRVREAARRGARLILVPEAGRADAEAGVRGTPGTTVMPLAGIGDALQQLEREISKPPPHA
jgi:DNA repair protein RadA/Sms